MCASEARANFHTVQHRKSSAPPAVRYPAVSALHWTSLFLLSCLVKPRLLSFNMIFDQVLLYNAINIHQSFLPITRFPLCFGSFLKELLKKKKKELVRVFLHFGATLKLHQKRSCCRNTMLCNRVATDLPKGSLFWCLMLSRVGRGRGTTLLMPPVAKIFRSVLLKPLINDICRGLSTCILLKWPGSSHTEARVELACWAERNSTSWADR